MKRTFSVLFCLAIVFGLFAGCSAKKDSPSSAITGAYSADRDITADERAMFDKVIATLDTAKTYEPLQVATQVVSGTNYRFTVTVDDNGTKYNAHIIIYQPLDGEPEFVSEEKIS